MALSLNSNLSNQYLDQIKNKESLHIRYSVKKAISNPIIKPNKLLLLTFCLSLVSVLLLNHLSIKTELYLNNLQKDILKITQSNELLNIKLEKEKNLDRIEKLAKENLNMRQMTTSEVTYLQSIKIDNHISDININIINIDDNNEVKVPLGY